MPAPPLIPDVFELFADVCTTAEHNSQYFETIEAAESTDQTDRILERDYYTCNCRSVLFNESRDVLW